MKMDDLQLGLAISTLNHDKKRTYHQSFTDAAAAAANSTNKRTLPLLIWEKRSCSDDDVEGEDRDVTVGWPPVRSWMKNFGRRECTAANYIDGGGGCDSMYVKVEMEGIGIARKIDLSIHHSYQSLTPTLLRMFGKGRENHEMYKLAYQDKEGDWLLAGDVPWGRFVRSVRRLKLARKEGVVIVGFGKCDGSNIN